MFRNDDLESHLKTSSTIKLNSAIVAEWNMNIATNIDRIGNYRYRPNDEDSPEYNFISQSFDLNDQQNRFYTDATDADVVVDGGVEEDGTPLAFVAKKEKERLLYSLEDCFGRFRPRSGINKLRYFDNKFSHFTNIDMASRPRYYMSERGDAFKYWTSYRTEDGIERGIANINLNDQNFIHDAAPFVVYREQIPANRIVVKMQTNVGEVDLGPFVQADSFVSDPFFGPENQTTPVNWRIEYLDNSNTWITASAFDANSVREDGSPIVGSDGYVELFYGLLVPEEYRNGFNLVDEVANELFLPEPTNFSSGTAYLLKESENVAGTVYVVRNNTSRTSGIYETFNADYGWFVDNEDVTNRKFFATELVSPPSFRSPSTGAITHREFQYIRGLRIVVETMNVFDSTFDLIELSPRLAVDISDKTVQFGITKSASDLGITGLPVGQLLASVGSLQLFDFDQAFFPENTNSIVSEYTSQNIQFKFYEIVKDVNDINGFDFYIPIKTMYSEGFPSIQGTDRSVSLELRDLFFYFEARNAPQILIQNASVSYAVSLLLDSIGFSNYVFKRIPEEDEEIIPYFFVAPDQSIAVVLQEIATSTQTAMFFDEFNNFILMSKDYMLPDIEDRDTDTLLHGSQDFKQEDVLKNKATKESLANIIDISFRDNQVYNAGVINYQTRSIQRSYGSLRQASLIDREKSWIYKPVLLWEAEGQENVRSQNDELENQTAYALTAIPLNSDLSDVVPSVRNHRVINNVIDFGDGVYWTARYDGYLFANGEIVRYDAIQFSIPGLSNIDPNNPNFDGDNVWISNVAEYQNYFSKIPFNGKMYPTGLVRIYSEPHFEVVGGVTRLKNGPVAKHGRAQFGTGVKKEDGTIGPAFHRAGLPDYWSDINNRRGCNMDFKYVFDERITRARFEGVTLESNASSGAVLNVSDPTIVNIGDFVFREFSSEDRSGAQLEEPTTNLIPSDTIVTAIDKTVLNIATTLLQNNVAIITTSFPHGLLQNDIITIEGATDEIYNGTYTVSQVIAPISLPGNPTPPISESLEFSYVRIGSNRSPVSSSGTVTRLNKKITISKQVQSVSDEEIVQEKRDSGADAINATTIALDNLEKVVVGLFVKNTDDEAENNIVQQNTVITAIDTSNNRITISKPLQSLNTEATFGVSIGKIKIGTIVLAELAPETTEGPSGIDNSVFKNSSVTGLIKNVLANQYAEEVSQPSKYPATIQSSALVFKGNINDTTEQTKDFISYVYKPMDDRFNHFGTRMRIVGKIENNEFRGQSAEGATTYYSAENAVTGTSPVISGGSGGLGVMINPSTNSGYYFEIAALSENTGRNRNKTIANVLFYKIKRNVSATEDSNKAIPVKLFSGLAQIIVDEGTFVGQSRLSAEQNPTVYDLAVEYQDIEGIRTFYLYINNSIVGIVSDPDPLPIVNNIALFVRGNAKCMFENVYALAENYSQNTTFSLETPVNSAFGEIDLNAQNSLQKYSLSGLIQSTYLSGISGTEPPKYNIYFEEFGTIMREASYFNIRYDKAYPALYAKIAETFTRVKGFTVAGFIASAYGAEFLIFNHTDTVLNLDSSSGNYLRIQGVTFTQQSQNELTVDEYFQNRTNFANPRYVDEGVVESPVDEKRYYTDIKLSRMTEGTKEFTLASPYIQSRDSAERMMKWLVAKIMKPRKSVGVSVFGMPHLQLGDVIEFDYKSKTGFEEISKNSSRFVVYNIEYQRSSSDIVTNIFLSEVS